MLKKIYSSLYILFISQFVWGQTDVPFTKEKMGNNNQEFHKALQSIKVGDNWLNKYHNTDSALFYYTIANTINSSNSELNYKIAYTHFLNQNFILADSFAIVSYNLKPTLDNIYLNARINHLTENTEKAISYYNSYLESYDNVTVPDKKFIEKLLKQVQNLSHKDSTIMACMNLDSLNSNFNETSPVLLYNTNQIFFTSDRFSPINLDFRSENIYYSTYDDSTFIQGKIVNNRAINIKGNSALSSISKSGKTMVIYHGFDVGRLYYSKLDLSENPVLPKSKTKLPSPITNFTNQVLGGTFTPDGKEFYFSTKRKEGKGAFDIYYTKRNGKKWVTPILVNGLNSEYNEIDPYFSMNGDTLYFASDNTNSIGGYDLFKSYRTSENEWSTPISLPIPINTPFDEKTPSSNETGDVLYFSSNRPNGLGGYDIYKTYIPEIQAIEVNVSSNGFELDSILNENLVDIEVYVLNKLDSSKINEAKVSIYTQPENILLRELVTDSLGKIRLRSIPLENTIGVNILSKGFELYSRQVLVDNPEKVYSIYLNPIKVNQTVTLNNIFFDVNSSKITSESTEELENLVAFLNVNNGIEIQIEGHTDNTGDNDINLTLSQKRADAIVSYLTLHGIDSKRLKSKGYGPEKPIASNDTEEGKALNRRTEFKIIKN